MPTEGEPDSEAGEWDCFDGTDLAAEDVFYLVAEEGQQRLGALGVEAPRSNVDTTVRSGFWVPIQTPSLRGTPAVVAAAEGENRREGLITRIDGLAGGGFDLGMDLEEAETYEYEYGEFESLAWIAIEHGEGVLSSGRVLSDVVSEAVSSEPVDWRVEQPDFIATDRFYPWIDVVLTLSEPDPSRGDSDERRVASVQLVVARCDSAKVLDTAEEALCEVVPF